MVGLSDNDSTSLSARNWSSGYPVTIVDDITIVDGESYCAAIVKIRILLARDDSNAAVKFNLFDAALSDTSIGSTDATISSTNSLVDVSVITYSDKTSNTAF